MAEPGFVKKDPSRRLAEINRAITTSLNFDEVLVSVPVIAKQSLNGLLVIAREQPLDADEQWQLSALADQAAIALQNARLYEMELTEKVLARDASEIARRRLAAIVESSEDAVVSKNLEGIIETWNKAAERVFGYRAREVIGKSITIVIPSDRIDEEVKI